jgi:hypothetical protein
MITRARFFQEDIERHWETLQAYNDKVFEPALIDEDK